MPDRLHVDDRNATRQVELLAPAGQWAALRAAAANGADAVYFGLGDFNARRRAANFRLDELPEVVGFLHDRNVRAYVALNTLIFPNELERAADYVRGVAAAGADAAIVQDLGLARLIRAMAPTLPLHASTQMTLGEAEGIDFARSLGVTRVILPRELSLAEIAALAAAADQRGVQVEVFAHGAMCISYSGQCLASLALGGRSGNRGQCAQPCRLRYQLLVDGRRHDTGRREHLLSPHDLCALEWVAGLREAGVAALKIEGRLKDEHYVAAATRAYRLAIDAAVAGRPLDLPDDDRDALERSFSRGFVSGYLGGADPKGLVAGGPPTPRGRCVGRVAAIAGPAVRVRLEGPDARPPQPGDGVAFQSAAGELVQGGRVYSVRPAAGGPPRGAGAGRGHAGGTHAGGTRVVELAFGKGDVDISQLAVGDRLWQTDDPQLRRRIARTFSRVEPVRRAGLSARVAAAPGRPLEMTVQDDAGHSVSLTGPQPLEAAVRHPLTTAMLREQLDRLGETPFRLADVRLEGPDGPAETVGVMVPRSQLGELRRRAVEALTARRRAAAVHVIAEGDALARLRAAAAAAAAATPPPQPPGPRLCILVREPRQLHAVLESAAAWAAAGARDTAGPLVAARAPVLIYADFADSAARTAAVAVGHEAAVPVALVGPRILKPGEEELVEQIAALAPAAVLARNLGTVRRLRRIAPHLPLIGDFSLNAANELTAAVLAEMGLARLTPACDLDLAGLRALAAAIAPALLEVPVYFHMPMFHTQHCLWAAHLSGGRGRDDCGRPCRTRGLALRDRKGMVMPIRREEGCRLTIYRGRADDHRDRLAELAAMGVGAVRVELLDEPPRRAAEVVGAVAAAMRQSSSGR